MNTNKETPLQLMSKAIILSKKIVDLEINRISICSDPMNGCPGDFSEALLRKSSILENQLLWMQVELNAHQQEIVDRVGQQYYSEKYESNIAILPWMQCENEYTEEQIPA